MGVTFYRPDFDVDYESKCYSRERGCFFEILRNLASFYCLAGYLHYFGM